MRTKGIGPNSLGSPFKKKGPCGGPNQPSCEEELKRMAKKQGFNKSYQNSMSVSNVGTMRSMSSGGSYMSPGHVNQAATTETKKRIKNVTSDDGYKAFTNNPNAKGVIRSVEHFIEGGRRGKSKAVRYQLPTKEESSSLINIGKKYVNSKDIMEDITPWDKAKAVYYGTKLVAKYPNLLSFGKSRIK
tara:strand:+ start:75 stop:635 length:561 start_codon:yes stop_codon:yes gene_type:complete